LRDVLMSRRDLFVENFIERLLTYSLGRGVEEYDRPIIRKIARETAPDDYRCHPSFSVSSRPSRSR